MAVDVQDIVDVAARTVDAYREAELQILAIVAHHLEQGIDAPTWAQDRLNALVSLRRAAQAVMARLATGDPAILAAVARAARNGRGGAVLDLPGPLGDAARAAQREVPQVAAIDSIAAALIRDVGEKRRNVLRHVEDVYRQTITAAVARSVAGGITRREASQAAWQGFVDRGVTSFTDVRGRVWRLSTYVEMAVRTVTMRAAVQGQTDRLIELGQHLVIVSDELGECPRCRPWEGKILRITPGPTGDVEVESAVADGMATVHIAGTHAEAMLAGLNHPNCGHTIRAYLPGATRQPTGPTEDPDNADAKVRQREIERAIRRHKEREVAGLTPEAKRAARIKVRQWQATMRQHLKDNPDLKRLPYREEIGGGNLPPGGKAPSPAGLLTGPSGGGSAGVDDRAARRAAARARQAEIDRRAPVADLLAEFDELLYKDTERAVYEQRLDLAATTGVDADAVAAMRRALDTGVASKIRAAITRTERKHGLKSIGRAGQTVKFDEALHEPVGDTPADGARVLVLRQGAVLNLDGETIQLTRARVTAVSAPAKATGPKLDPVAIPDGVPDLGDLFTAGVQLMESDPAKYPNGVPLDPAPWQLLMGGGFSRGVTVKVDQAVLVKGWTAGQPSISIQATIHRNGKKIGHVTRVYRRQADGTLIAVHASLGLSKKEQGSRFSRELNGRLIAWYRRSGVDHVKVHANVDVGGYAWAAYGYDFQDDRAVAKWLAGARWTLRLWKDPANQDLRKLLPKLTDAERREQIKLLEDLLDVADVVRPVSAYEISQLGRKLGQKGKTAMWIGKVIMLGTDWHGVLQLRP